MRIGHRRTRARIVPEPAVLYGTPSINALSLAAAASATNETGVSGRYSRVNSTTRDLNTFRLAGSKLFQSSVGIPRLSRTRRAWPTRQGVSTRLWRRTDSRTFGGSEVL